MRRAMFSILMVMTFCLATHAQSVSSTRADGSLGISGLTDSAGINSPVVNLSVNVRNVPVKNSFTDRLFLNGSLGFSPRLESQFTEDGHGFSLNVTPWVRVYKSLYGVVGFERDWYHNSLASSKDTFGIVGAGYYFTRNTQGDLTVELGRAGDSTAVKGEIQHICARKGSFYLAGSAYFRAISYGFGNRDAGEFGISVDVGRFFKF